jgi:hypothetical protein
MNKSAKFFVILLTVFAVSTSPLYADNLTQGDLLFNLDSVYTGSTTPQGTPPWLTTTFVNLGLNSVQLTLEYSALPTASNEYVSSWFFNFNPSSEVLGLSIIPQSGIVADPIIKATDGVKAGDLSYDIQFSFAANSFNPGETSIYLLSSNISGEPIDALSFNFLSTNPLGLTNYYSSANILGISGGFNSWIAAATAQTPGPGPGPAPIPEPATMLLIGTGLTGIAFFRRKKFMN